MVISAAATGPRATSQPEPEGQVPASEVSGLVDWGGMRWFAWPPQMLPENDVFARMMPEGGLDTPPMREAAWETALSTGALEAAERSLSAPRQVCGGPESSRCTMSDPVWWNRRSFLKTGVAAGAATLACAPQQPRLVAEARPRLRTRLCDLLGIEYPVLQSGMAPIGGPELAAAVSAAGGLGILGLAHVEPEEVRRRIREVRRRTDRPFGANLLLHEQLWPPVDAGGFPDAMMQSIHAVLNRFRARLRLPARSDRAPTRPNHVPGAIEVMLEERVPVFSVGLGNPPREVVERFHAQGAKVVAMVATVEDARAVAANGVDAIIAQGSDAGGHRSSWRKPPSAQHAAVGTMSLVPDVVQAVDVPVVAAGGITGGRGIIAALALGADGVMVGTRFIATPEARAGDFYKQALLAGQGDETVITDAWTGLYARVLRNAYTEAYGASGAPTLPGYVQLGMNGDIIADALRRGDRDFYPLWAGQGVGLVRDVAPAGDVLHALVREAEDALRELTARV